LKCIALRTVFIAPIVYKFSWNYFIRWSL